MERDVLRAAFMSDIQKSPSHLNKPSEEWSKVPEIEKIKHKKEEHPIEEKKKLSLLLTSVIVYFKNLLSAFSIKKRSSSSIFDKQRVLEDLLALRKVLQILCHENQSRNPEFIQQMSELWHNLLDDCNTLDQLSRKSHPFLTKMKQFLNKISQFPPSEDHPLGYYLTEYVGAEWLPFPFMEMIYQLHQQYQKDPESSELQKWMSTLNQLISEFDKEP